MSPVTLESRPDTNTPKSAGDSFGVSFWMARVEEECKRVRREFAPDAVHDLRVALRRCRSIADGYMALDPDPTWQKMKQAGKGLFSKLGELRDTHVMIQWTRDLAGSRDEAGSRLRRHLTAREDLLQDGARKAIRNFNRRKWASWGSRLAERSGRVALESLVFQHLALEYLHAARDLHRQACRNRSVVSFHRLRIGLKRFRYTLENFLPERHGIWGKDLKELQDLLGGMHDLRLLWQTALDLGAFRDDTMRATWHSRIEEEYKLRLGQYRERMIGRTSLWRAWFAGLPGDDQVQDAAMARMQAWASYRDPDPAHSEHIARLAVQLCYGLMREGFIEKGSPAATSSILWAAALLHNVGRAGDAKKPHKEAYRMIRRLEPLLGWTEDSLQQVALAVRYCTGALPNVRQRPFGRLSEEQQQSTILSGGILRLAAALDMHHDQRTRSVDVQQAEGTVTILVEQELEMDPLAEGLSDGKALLQAALRCPIVISPLTRFNVYGSVTNGA